VVGAEQARPRVSGVPDPYFFLAGAFLVLQPPLAAFFAAMNTSLFAALYVKARAAGREKCAKLDRRRFGAPLRAPSRGC